MVNPNVGLLLFEVADDVALNLTDSIIVPSLGKDLLLSLDVMVVVE